MPNIIYSSVGAASDTFQSFNATGTILAWGSVIDYGNTAPTANGILTIPPCSAASVGKKIRIRRSDSTAFTLTTVPSGADIGTIDTPAALNGTGAITIQCVSATSYKQISNIAATILAESGETALSGTIAVNTNLTGTIAIPSAGKWRINAIVNYDCTLDSGSILQIVDSSGVVQPLSTVRTVLAGTNQTQHPVEVVVATATAANYFVRFGATIPTAATINAGGGSSVARWQKISGFLAVAGQSVQKQEVLLTGLASTAPAAATWTDVTGAIAIPANIDVTLGYQIAVFKSTAGLVNFRLFNVTDNLPVANTLGTSQHETVSFSGSSVKIDVQSSAAAIAKTYKVQFQTNNGGTLSLDTANTTCKLSYIQSGSTATVGVAGNVGDAKTGFQIADHNGWILLDGRLKSTLSPTQQAAATGLGFGTNLPNPPAGATLVKGTLGTIVGSATISQANLPSVNLTSDAISAGTPAGTIGSVSAGTPAGTVNIITHSSDAGGFDPNPTAGISNLQQTDRTPENTITLGVSIGGGFTGSALPSHNHAFTGSVLANHSHSIPLGGAGAAYTPLGLGVNMFVYLGT